jgi:hypothetical protein
MNELCASIGCTGFFMPRTFFCFAAASALKLFLTMLYCSMDRLRRAGAPMQNLVHSASFDFLRQRCTIEPGDQTPSLGSYFENETGLV